MLVKNATEQDLRIALSIINCEKYDDNAEFKALNVLGPHAVRFTLGVKDSKKVGAKISDTQFGCRRTRSACWHLHGDFFDALFDMAPHAVITSGFYTKPRKITKEAGNWEDVQIGTKIHPVMHSEACACKR